MRARIRFGLILVFLTAGFLGAVPASRAQATWTNGTGNFFYATAGNWSPASVPTNTGSEALDLPVLPGSMEITLNTNANVSGIVLSGSSGTAQYDLQGFGSNTLTIGAGGIAVSGPIGAYMSLAVPTTLSASQTWDGSDGYVVAYDPVSSGAGNVLTVKGTVYLFALNPSLLGGVDVLTNASLNIEDGDAGAGLLTLQPSAVLNSFFDFQGLTLANAVSLGANATLTESGYTTYRLPLTLTGPLSVPLTNSAFAIGSFSQVVATGTLSGPTNTHLEIDGFGSQLPYDGGSSFVFTGSTSQVTDLTLNNVAVVLAPVASFGSVPAGGLHMTNAAYLGLDGSFVGTGVVSAFLSTYGPALGPAIDGTIGFDTTNTAGPTNVFSDPVDLSNFTSGNFYGLGSSTIAILGASAVITPAANTYYFGGGGGTLIVQSPLADGGSPRNLVMTNAKGPLTLILQGGSSYTDGTRIQTGTNGAGVLIFDSNAPLVGQIGNNFGYVGETEMATNLTNANQFIGLFNLNNANGVIGFDSTVPTNERTVSDPLTLTRFAGLSDPFLGTATDVTLSGTITPVNGHYQFTGVKGGQLSVSSTLSGTGTQVVIGLQAPLEANGTQSGVMLSGSNTYSGGTIFNSGGLFVTNSNSLGSGGVTVPNALGGVPITPFLSPAGGDVTLATPISVAQADGGNSTGLNLGNPSTSDMLTLTGPISDDATPGQIGIVGNVTFAAANTYSGGTAIAGDGNATLFLNGAGSIGSGPLLLENSGSLIATSGTIQLPNAVELGNELTLGSYNGVGTLVLTGVISGNSGLDIESTVELDGANTFLGNVTVNNALVTLGNAEALSTGSVSLFNSNLTYTVADPEIFNLEGDIRSQVNLISGSILTLNVPSEFSETNYQGNLNGDATNQLVKTGPGAQELSGLTTLNGGTSINNGLLIAGSSQALGTGPVAVASGAVLAVDAGATLTNALSLSAGSTLQGAGTFAPAAPVAIQGGVTVQPGIPVLFEPLATLNFSTNVSFGQGGHLQRFRG